MAAAPEQIGSNRQFGGYNRRYKVRSDALQCDTTFTIYFPPAAEAGAKVERRMGGGHALQSVQCP